MKHTYKVTGMTCAGCKASVEKHLSALPNVTSVMVNLEKETARVTMDEHVNVEEMQKALPEKFSIAPISNDSTNSQEKNIFDSVAGENDNQEASKLKQLQPLFLIFSCIILSTLALNYQSFNISEVMLDFMGLFFMIFSLFKFFDLAGFKQSFSMYDPLAKMWPGYAYIYPFVELVLGLLFLSRLELEVALVVTLIVLIITTVGVTRSLFGKQQIECACLGTVLRLPMTQATFIENAIMITMAVFMIFKMNIL